MPSHVPYVAAVTAAAFAGGVWYAWPPNRGTLASSQPTDPETLQDLLGVLEVGTPLGSASGGELLFVDLGSGDGRVVNAVVGRFACRGVGVDVMPESVAEAAAAAAKTLPADLSGRSSFIAADMAAVDLAEANIVFMFLPRDMTRQVVTQVLPQSGLRSGAYVLLNDPPEDLRFGYGLRYLRRAESARPPSSKYPPVDLFEWRGTPDAKRHFPPSAYFRCDPAQPKVSLVAPVA